MMMPIPSSAALKARKAIRKENAHGSHMTHFDNRHTKYGEYVLICNPIVAFNV
jgi:hypothetical protein